jgi:hypothetical protein
MRPHIVLALIVAAISTACRLPVSGVGKPCSKSAHCEDGLLCLEGTCLPGSGEGEGEGAPSAISIRTRSSARQPAHRRSSGRS